MTMTMTPLDTECRCRQAAHHCDGLEVIISFLSKSLVTPPLAPFQVSILRLLAHLHCEALNRKVVVASLPSKLMRIELSNREWPFYDYLPWLDYLNSINRPSFQYS